MPDPASQKPEPNKATSHDNTARPDFKYTVEHAFTVTCDWAGFLAPAQLASVSKGAQLPVTNIYLIGQRPRITVQPGSWQCTQDQLSFVVRSDRGNGESIDVLIEGPNPFPSPVSLVTAKPYTTLRLHDAHGNLVTGCATGMWVSMYLHEVMGFERRNTPGIDETLLDLDIVYVGQSQDPEGATHRRLLNHSTLQRILADTAQNAPHLDTWIVLMSFGSYDTIGTLGGWLGSEGEDASLHHLNSVHTTQLSAPELTALTEAALIRYFQPSYNSTFKHHFPEPLHKTYRTVYDLDINAVGIDFETLTTIGLRLGSAVVAPTFIHTGLFSVHDPAERRRFFDIDQWGGTVASNLHFTRDRRDER